MSRRLDETSTASRSAAARGDARLHRGDDSAGAATGRLRAAVLVGLAGAAAASSWWRAAHGQHPLPGPVDLTLLIAVIGLFVVLDLAVGYSTAVWLMVGLLAAGHLVFSLPARHPLYSFRPLGSDVLRVDHLEHLAAGALLAWIMRAAVLRRSVRPSRWTLVAVPVGAVVLFALSKETLDALAVAIAHPALSLSDTIAAWSAHRDENLANTMLDVAADLVGAIAVCVWSAWWHGLTAEPPSRRDGSPPTAATTAGRNSPSALVSGKRQ